MSIKLRTVIRRISLTQILLRCIGVILAYVIGAHVTGQFHASSYMGAMLACTSTVVVMQAEDSRESMRKGWLRVVSTLIGAIIATTYLQFFPFSLHGLAISFCILEAICMAMKVPDGGVVAAMTLIIISVISQELPDLPPLTNGVLRFVEGTVGVFIGVAELWIVEQTQTFYTKKKGSNHRI